MSPPVPACGSNCGCASGSRPATSGPNCACFQSACSQLSVSTANTRPSFPVDREFHRKRVLDALPGSEDAALGPSTTAENTTRMRPRVSNRWQTEYGNQFIYAQPCNSTPTVCGGWGEQWPQGPWAQPQVYMNQQQAAVYQSAPLQNRPNYANIQPPMLHPHASFSHNQDQLQQLQLQQLQHCQQYQQQQYPQQQQQQQCCGGQARCASAGSQRGLGQTAHAAAPAAAEKAVPKAAAERKKTASASEKTATQVAGTAPEKKRPTSASSHASAPSAAVAKTAAVVRKIPVPESASTHKTAPAAKARKGAKKVEKDDDATSIISEGSLVAGEEHAVPQPDIYAEAPPFQLAPNATAYNLDLEYQPMRYSEVWSNFEPAKRSHLDPHYYKFLPHYYTTLIAPAGVKTGRSWHVPDCLDVFE
eukprot:ANDGO_01987.mRNA.1 hypothetical protein